MSDKTMGTLREAVQIAKMLDSSSVVVPRTTAELLVECVQIVHELGIERVNKIGSHKIIEFCNRADDIQWKAQELLQRL